MCIGQKKLTGDKRDREEGVKSCGYRGLKSEAIRLVKPAELFHHAKNERIRKTLSQQHPSCITIQACQPRQRHARSAGVVSAGFCICLGFEF